MSSYAVVNPATGDKVEEYPEASDADLSAAIAAAEKAHAEWSQTSSVADRAGLIQKVADFHGERREELAAIAVKEMGKPMEQALGEVDFCVDIYGYYAERAEEFMKDEPIDLLAGDGSALIRRTSMGPLIGIMPWNSPTTRWPLRRPNLIVGNTILLKPAPVPESAEAMQKMYDDAGFRGRLPDDPRVERPDRGDHRRPGSGASRSRAPSAPGRPSPRSRAAISRRSCLSSAARTFILLKTGDLDEAVQAAVDGRLDNTGQSCNAAKRFIVADDLYDDFLEKFSAKMKEAEPGDDGRRHRDRPCRLRPPPSACRTSSTRGRAGAEVVVGGERKDSSSRPLC